MMEKHTHTHTHHMTDRRGLGQAPLTPHPAGPSQHLGPQELGSCASPPMGLASGLEAGLAVAQWRPGPHLDRKVKVPAGTRRAVQDRWKVVRKA